MQHAEPPPAIRNEQVGIIKSYNSEKGFGFISIRGTEDDLFFQKDELPVDVRDTHGKDLTGSGVSFEPVTGRNGRSKAVRIEIIDQAKGERHKGVVKSFSEKNGYGFINCPQLEQDVRFGGEEVPDHVSKDRLVGQKVTFQTQTLKDGKMRAHKVEFVNPPLTEAAMQSFGLAAQASAAVLEDYSNPECMLGTVKSFSEKNGYGFITVPGFPIDVKFGRNDMQPDLQGLPGSSVRGLAITFLPSFGVGGGLQAKQVTVAGPGPAPGQKRGPMDDLEGPPTKLPRTGADPFAAPLLPLGNGAFPSLQPGELAQGTVRLYNAEKGWGFIKCDQLPGDVYFMRKNVAEVAEQVRSGELDLKGKTVSFQIAAAPEGPNSRKLRASSVFLFDSLAAMAEMPQFGLDTAALELASNNL